MQILQALLVVAAPFALAFRTAMDASALNEVTTESQGTTQADVVIGFDSVKKCGFWAADDFDVKVKLTSGAWMQTIQFSRQLTAFTGAHRATITIPDTEPFDFNVQLKVTQKRSVLGFFRDTYPCGGAQSPDPDRYSTLSGDAPTVIHFAPRHHFPIGGSVFIQRQAATSAPDEDASPDAQGIGAAVAENFGVGQQAVIANDAAAEIETQLLVEAEDPEKACAEVVAGRDNVKSLVGKDPKNGKVRSKSTYNKWETKCESKATAPGYKCAVTLGKYSFTYDGAGRGVKNTCGEVGRWFDKQLKGELEGTDCDHFWHQCYHGDGRGGAAQEQEHQCQRGTYSDMYMAVCIAKPVEPPTNS